MVLDDWWQRYAAEMSELWVPDPDDNPDAQREDSALFMPWL